MRILFTVGHYPSAARDNNGTFVRQLVLAMAAQGHECVVVNPVSVFDWRYGALPRPAEQDRAPRGGVVDVVRPRYLSLSSRSIGAWHTGRLTQWQFRRTVLRWLSGATFRPDAVYGHFLYPGGDAAVEVAERLGVPSFVGVGEGSLWTVDAFGFERARRMSARATGFIAVASHVRDLLVEQLAVPPGRIVVEPNGVDLEVFRPRSREWARARVGIPADTFLVVVVGSFLPSKGGAEVLEAVRGMANVGVAMIGSGPLRFSSESILFAGTVRHADVPWWLNAADAFVLPTREEGSCNAVIEAMACGVPIVTSNGRYMDDIVDDDVALRVDPTDAIAIREAITRLRRDPDLRAQLSRAALARAQTLDIRKRAERITAFMARGGGVGR